MPRQVRLDAPGVLQHVMARGIERRKIFWDDKDRSSFLERLAVIQAVAGYPLTVYGKGGQTRGYLNIKDTIACVKLAVMSPADAGELRVLNQITETFTVNELAEKVARVGKELGHTVEIKSIENPRKELEEHYYNPTYTGLKELGLKPHYLTDEVMADMLETVIKYKENIQTERIFRGVKW